MSNYYICEGVVISHYELCKLTAEKNIKKSTIVLYEYQSYATSEFPDVLCFRGGYTKLFEIKITHTDFKKDEYKECRKQHKIKYFTSFTRNQIEKITGIRWESLGLREFISQMPHLGRERYYVCPEGVIKKDEIKNGFGLYWYNGEKLKLKKESSSFKCNVYDELRILEHAFRKYYCGDGNNILVNGYKTGRENASVRNP
jgi:hypothetical protein